MVAKMNIVRNITGIIFLMWCVCANAQFLPDNNQLSVQSVQRWMESNRDLNPIVSILDEMNPSEDDLKLFDSLPAIEQDKKITMFLQQKKLFDTANAIALRHGWKSVGEYMRLSTRLGNAIAAYFLAAETEKLSADQRKQVFDKTDPAILVVSPGDIAFVKNNEKLLKDYIAAYGKGK